MELPCFDVGIERHVDGAAFAAENPKLRRCAIFLEHRRTKCRLDIGFVEPDQPINPLRPGLRRIVLGLDGRVGRRGRDFAHRSLGLRVRDRLGRDRIRSARVQRPAGAELGRRLRIDAARNEHGAEHADQMPFPTQLHARSAMNSTRAKRDRPALERQHTRGPSILPTCRRQGRKFRVPLGWGLLLRVARTIPREFDPNEANRDFRPEF